MPASTPTPRAAGLAARGRSRPTRGAGIAAALSLLVLGALAWAALAPIERSSRDELFEIPQGTWARRMAGEKVEILPGTIRLTLGINDVLLLRNSDDVPQAFGPALVMPGQSFRLPFAAASTYSFACSAHASGQLTVIVDPSPERGLGNAALALARPGERDALAASRRRVNAMPTGPGTVSTARARLSRFVLPLIVILVVIAVWWIVVVRTESAIFPTPWQVVTGAFELAQDGTLWEHIGASLFRVGTGFGLALVVAIPLGLWMGWVGGVYRTLNPIFQMLRPISPIAWIPLAILWFGVGDVSPIFLIFISSVFPMIVQTTSGVHTIERRYLRAAANFGVSRSVLFRRVVIPAVLPEIIVGMRIGIGVAWLVVVAAEMIALRSGLGYLIMDSRNAGNRYDLVIASMIIIGVIGLLLDGTTRLLERLKTVRWRYVR